MNIINDVLVDKLFKDPPKRTREIPLLSEKTASGDGMVVINDAYSDFPITNLTLRGKSEQVQTTGKNLFDDSKNEKGYYTGGLGTVSELVKTNGWSWSSPLNAIENTTLSVSVVSKIKSRFQIILADDLNTVLYVNTKHSAGSTEYTHSFNVVEGTTKILISVYEETSPEGVTIMLNEGVRSSPYEPYTGGKPSPSPEYPQEIKNVGKWNEEKQKYEVDVKITRKNLFDKEYAKRKDVWKLPNSGYSYIPIYVGKGKRITVSTSGNPKTGLNFYCTITKTVSKTHENVYTWLYHSTIENLIKTKVTFSVTESDYIYFSLSDGVNNIEKFLSAFPDFQIEYGEERTDYEPYKEQTLTLTSDRPITKWDKLVEQDGQIGWLYQSAIDEYSGETNVSPYKTGFGFYFLLENKNIESGEGYCEELQQYTSEKVPCIHFNLAKNTYVYTLNTETIYGSTVSDIKNYLKTHPLHIVYKTETTEFIPLPKEEQDAIRALKTYYPTTVITVNGGELPVGIEVTYMHPEYIPTKQSALRMWFKENPII